MSEYQNNNTAWHKEAAAIARQFLMTFNGAMLYGCEHPNTVKNATALCETLANALTTREMITVISNNGTFIIEDWPLDGSFNTAKLVAHFERIGLVSISFERGVSADSMILLTGLAGDVRNIDMCKVGLDEAKRTKSIPGIRINYVHYGKITADLAATAAAGGTGITGAGASNITTGTLSRTAAEQIEEVLTLASLLQKPQIVSTVLSQTDTSVFSVNDLQKAFGKIKGEIDSSETHSADELLGSLYNLKKDLYEAIEIQKATGNVMRSAAVINKEIDGLTIRTIVKLIKEEYKSGKTPLNKLAHTIRRILPSNTELMSILPHLKETLLAEGMPLADYLELVRGLGLKIESESLSGSLKEAAEAMGASVADLVSAIRSKPEEAARLILLASEIRQGMGEEVSGLSEKLTDYIEQVCTKMAADTCGSVGNQDGGTLKKVLAQLEAQMFNQLSKQGVPSSVLKNVKQLLTDRFNDTFAAITETAATNAAPAPSDAKIGKMKMPADALSVNNLLFLINKEIKRNLRYSTPFATITVSIEKIIQNDIVRPPKQEDNTELIPQVFTAVEALLRDVDLIGAIGADNNPELFILLPMTGEEGATIVKNRILKMICKTTFTLANRSTGVKARVSAAFPNSRTKDIKSYLALTRYNHNND